jgi:hypothetical protein
VAPGEPSHNEVNELVATPEWIAAHAVASANAAHCRHRDSVMTGDLTHIDAGDVVVQNALSQTLRKLRRIGLASRDPVPIKDAVQPRQGDVMLRADCGDCHVRVVVSDHSAFVNADEPSIQCLATSAGAAELCSSR